MNRECAMKPQGNYPINKKHYFCCPNGLQEMSGDDFNMETFQIHALNPSANIRCPFRDRKRSAKNERRRGGMNFGFAVVGLYFFRRSKKPLGIECITNLFFLRDCNPCRSLIKNCSMRVWRLTWNHPIPRSRWMNFVVGWRENCELLSSFSS